MMKKMMNPQYEDLLAIEREEAEAPANSDEKFESAVLGDGIRLYFRDIAARPRVTREEEQDLARRLRSGDKAAREKLIEANLRLVVSVAKRYSQYGAELIDLIQEGNIGLMHAVDRYDPALGFCFSTYATWWIKNYILRSITNTSRTIRLPVHIAEQYHRIHHMESEIFNETGEDATDEALAKAANLSQRKVRFLRRRLPDTTSLNQCLSDEGSTELGDKIADVTSEDPADIVEREMMLESFDKLLREVLTDRERDIFKKRFGIGGKKMTLAALGAKYGCTRERARQIAKRARDKVRAQGRLSALRDKLACDT